MCGSPKGLTSHSLFAQIHHGEPCTLRARLNVQRAFAGLIGLELNIITSRNRENYLPAEGRMVPRNRRYAHEICDGCGPILQNSSTAVANIVCRILDGVTNEIIPTYPRREAAVICNSLVHPVRIHFINIERKSGISRRPDWLNATVVNLGHRLWMTKPCGAKVVCCHPTVGHR